ncbi:30S ribosomal protein S17e [Candidatus Woesearchaeota archaeon]|nr:30S ribosomal protein S17e [Candidatus Woesearchaeota archaeon]
MGRIKTQLVKRITNDLIREHSKELKKDFDENKEIIGKFAKIPSTKMRNVIAGYVTRRMKNDDDL